MGDDGREDKPNEAASTVVSYLLLGGGGALLGFLMALCAIGRQARFLDAHNDAVHALIIGSMTIGGAVTGVLAVYRTLGQRKRRGGRR